jgi:hypothetical protein
MIVISNNANSVYGSTLFSDIKATVEDVTDEAGLPTPSFYKYPSYPQLFDPGLSKSAVFNLATINPTYINARTSATADVVLFVLSQVNEPTAEGCGAARGFPARKIDLVADLVDGHHLQNANTLFAAFITLIHPGCVTLDPLYSAAHEIGHVLFAEHEVIFLNGEAVDEVGGNGDVNLPTKENHPKISGSNRTIMFSGGPSASGKFYSKQGKKFPGGANAYGTYSKVANYMANTSYDYVAHYRRPAPPPACNLIVDFNGCHATLQYTVTASLPGYTVTNMNMDYRYGTTGEWIDWFDGIFTCPGFNTPVLRTIRAILTTASGLSQCEVYVYPQICDDEPW